MNFDLRPYKEETHAISLVCSRDLARMHSILSRSSHRFYSKVFNVNSKQKQVGPELGKAPSQLGFKSNLLVSDYVLAGKAYLQC